MVLLDLSAAFDTVDHILLLSILRNKFYITGTALDWFRSYLRQREMVIRVPSSLSPSKPRPLQFGVPQGSVLGPVLFSLYTSGLGDVIKSHGIQFMFYADDTQLYLPFDPDSLPAAIMKMERCLQDIRDWMTCHFLKLNDDKTELIIFRSRFNTRTPTPCELRIGNSCISPTSTIRNLGFFMDTTLTMDSHINNTCKSIIYHLRQIGQLRKFLDTPSTEKLVHAVVSSRLDYCNCLLFGLPSSSIQRLQRLQNTAARIVVKSPRSAHITPILESLHWLPVQYRIQYKLLCLVFRAVTSSQPAYLSSILRERSSLRPSRLQYQHLLEAPQSRTSTYGGRALSRCGPSLWNSLPVELRSLSSMSIFRDRLKTYLFRQCFN